MPINHRTDVANTPGLVFNWREESNVSFSGYQVTFPIALLETSVQNGSADIFGRGDAHVYYDRCQSPSLRSVYNATRDNYHTGYAEELSLSRFGEASGDSRSLRLLWRSKNDAGASFRHHRRILQQPGLPQPHLSPQSALRRYSLQLFWSAKSPRSDMRCAFCICSCGIDESCTDS